MSMFNALRADTNTPTTKLAGTVMNIGKESTVKRETTDAEEVINLLNALRERSEILRIDTANKLSCVIVDRPTAECEDEPHHIMSPIFYDMFRVIKDLERSLRATQKSVSDAQLPVYYSDHDCESGCE